MKIHTSDFSQSRPAPGGFVFSASAKNMLLLSARLFWKALVALALTVAVCDINGQSTGTAANEPTVPDAWAAGPDLPSVGVRLAGVFFPANGKFYGMGGRSSDVAGNEFTHPFEYDPATNTWTTKSATYPDIQVNNIACGVLSDAGTPYIYCVGGSDVASQTTTGRVFRYNPVTDSITTVAAPWPGAGANAVLPGGFTIFQNKLYILGGFDIPAGSGTSQIWEFTPTTNAWVQKVTSLPVPLGYIPTTTIGNLIYTGGGSDITGGLLTDTTNSFVYNPVANTISTIAPIPRATGETRALNFNGKMLVMGGGRTSPNPSNEVDVYTPGTNTWAVNSPVPAFTTARRNFPTDTDGTTKIWLAGGYAPTTPVASMEIFTGGAPVPSSAVSRKVHGAAGTFDVNLPLVPIGGAVGIECRTGLVAGAHQEVITFASPVTVSGVAVTSGTGSATFSGNGTTVITVDLTGVTNAQRLGVTLMNVNNAGDVMIPMGVLSGDTNANGAVNAGDAAQTKGQSGVPVGAGNFRTDVNSNGAINAGDVAIVKGKAGTALPP